MSATSRRSRRRVNDQNSKIAIAPAVVSPSPLPHTDAAFISKAQSKGLDMIRIAKLFAVAAVLAICLPIQPSSAAEGVAYVSATGGGSACTQTAPCATFQTAFSSLPNGGRVVCMTPVTEFGPILFSGIFDFDCPSTTWTGEIVLTSGTLRFQHISFSGLGTTASVITVNGGGTLIFDDCVIEDIAGTGLDLEPTAPLNLVITNSRISNNAAGVLIEPAAGGSVTATFNGVTIVDNSGGGLKTQSTNGTVTVDISNSTISNNAGNGVNAVGPVNNVIMNLKNDVIASNGSAGIQANGGNAAVTVDNTSILNNATAFSAVVGGRILTYGNNSIVGSPGTGFTGPAALQ